MLIAIFRRKAKDISGQRVKQGYVISGASGPKIPLHLTGPTRDGLKLHEVMFMKAVVSNAMKICFPAKLSKAGEDAHLYYTQTKKTDELNCINCHLNAGHFIEGYTHGSNSTFGNTSSAAKEIFTEPAKVTEFKNFTELIPKSSVSFNMVAIPGGKFKYGQSGR